MKLVDQDFDIIAKQLMEDICICNGVVNRFEPMRFPKKWLLKIKNACKVFFETSPHLVTDKVIQEFADGFALEREEKWGHLRGYKDLDSILNEYFNSL